VSTFGAVLNLVSATGEQWYLLDSTVHVIQV